MKYLSDDEIIEVVKEYISDTSINTAIMIDGAWGSGKTFFVEKKLIPKIEECNEIEIEKDKKCNIETDKKISKFIYISTYGVKDTGGIDNKIFEKIIEEAVPNSVEKFYKKIGKKVISIYDIIKAFKEWPDIPKESIKSLLKGLQDKSKYIFIFDDIERCDIPINELLGYINDFVEHQNIKVILIANEDEMANRNIFSNIELKYMLVANEKIEFNEKEEQSLLNLYNQKEKDNIKKKIKIKNLNDRVKEIFGEDFIYDQIKEKLIGKTIYYKPDLNKVIKTLIQVENYNQEIKDYLMKMSDTMADMMEMKNHINIRTIKSVLKTLSKIYPIIWKIEVDEKEMRLFENFKDEVFLYTTYAYIRNRNGEKNINWSKNSEFGYLELEEISEKLIGFKFIDEIITKSVIDEERIKKVEKLFIQSQLLDLEDTDKSLEKLKCYWEMEDNDIDQILDEVQKNIELDIYDKRLYPRIIITVMRIVNMGFEKKILDKIISSMKENIVKMEKKIKFEDYDISFRDNKEIEEYQKKIQEIKEVMDESAKVKQVESINNIINEKNGWGMMFRKYYMENKDESMKNKEFFKLVDINNLIESIDKSNTKDLSDFRRTLGSAYGFSNIKEFYKDDAENIEEFIKGLKKLDINSYSKSKKYNIELLENAMKETLEKLL